MRKTIKNFALMILVLLIALPVVISVTVLPTEIGTDPYSRSTLNTNFVPNPEVLPATSLTPEAAQPTVPAVTQPKALGTPPPRPGTPEGGPLINAAQSANAQTYRSPDNSVFYVVPQNVQTDIDNTAKQSAGVQYSTYILSHSLDCEKNPTGCTNAWNNIYSQSYQTALSQNSGVSALPGYLVPDKTTVTHASEDGTSFTLTTPPDIPRRSQNDGQLPEGQAYTFTRRDDGGYTTSLGAGGDARTINIIPAQQNGNIGNTAFYQVSGDNTVRIYTSDGRLYGTYDDAATGPNSQLPACGNNNPPPCTSNGFIVARPEILGIPGLVTGCLGAGNARGTQVGDICAATTTSDTGQGHAGSFFPSRVITVSYTQNGHTGNASCDRSGQNCRYGCAADSGDQNCVQANCRPSANNDCSCAAGQNCMTTTCPEGVDCDAVENAGGAQAWSSWVSDISAWQTFGSGVWSMLQTFHVDVTQYDFPFLAQSREWFENSILGRVLTLDEQLICRTRQNFNNAVKRGFLPTSTGQSGADIQATRTSVLNVSRETGAQASYYRYKITLNVDASALFSTNLVTAAQVGKLKFYVSLGGINIISTATAGAIGNTTVISLDVKTGPSSWGTTTLGNPIVYETPPGAAAYSEACIKFTDGVQYMTGFVQSFLSSSGNTVCNTIG